MRATIELTDHQAQVLKLRTRRRTFQQIGDDLGCTRQRAIQLHEQAMRRIVAQIEKQRDTRPGDSLR